jgi:hypothetical protein
VPPRRVRFEIEVQEDLAIGQFAGGASDVMAARQLTDFLQVYFTGKCQRHA